MTIMKNEILEQPDVLSRLEEANKQTLTSIVKVLEEKKIKNIKMIKKKF